MSETKVSSLPAAAYAIAKGAKFLRCEAGTPGRAEFIFDDPHANVTATARDFFLGCEVSARDYYRALQDVRWAVNRVLRPNGGAR